MACDTDYRIDFDPKACLLERQNSDSLPLLTFDEVQAEHQRLWSRWSKKDPDGGSKSKTRLKIPKLLGSDESDEEHLLDDTLQDVFDDVSEDMRSREKTMPVKRGSECQNDLNSTRETPKPESHQMYANVTFDSGKGQLDDAAETYLTGNVPEAEVQGKSEAVLEKLLLAETDVEESLKRAVDIINNKKELLLQRLDAVRRKKEGGRANGKKTPIQILKTSPRVSPAHSDAEEEPESVFVRKKVIKTDKKKREMKMLTDIDVVLKKTEEISMAVRKINYMTPFLVAKIVADVQTDEETTDLVDVLSVRVDDKIIVMTTDFKNSSLKSFSHGQGEMESSVLKFDNSPWGLTRMDDNTVAVSIPLAFKLCLVAVKDGLKLVETVKTKKQYYGIVAIGSSILVATSPYSNPRSVDTVDLTGAILKTLPIATLLQQPSFICRTAPGFVVSDLAKGTLVGVSNVLDIGAGYEMSDESRMQSTRGVASNEVGDVFVVDYREKKVKVFSSDGHFLKDFLTSGDGLKYPYGVCFDDHGHLYVTDGGVIKIFSY